MILPRPDERKWKTGIPVLLLWWMGFSETSYYCYYDYYNNFKSQTFSSLLIFLFLPSFFYFLYNFLFPHSLNVFSLFISLYSFLKLFIFLLFSLCFYCVCNLYIFTNVIIFSLTRNMLCILFPVKTLWMNLPFYWLIFILKLFLLLILLFIWSQINYWIAIL